jgi:hypothetical protein
MILGIWEPSSQVASKPIPVEIKYGFTRVFELVVSFDELAQALPEALVAT